MPERGKLSMAKGKKELPYMVASYLRCEDVRHLRNEIRIDRCVKLALQYGQGKKEAEEELQKEVEKILRLEKRVFELERRTFLQNREILSASMTIDVIKEIILSFYRKTLLFESELEEYLKATKTS